MPNTIARTRLTDALFCAHMLSYHSTGDIVGSFEWVPGYTEAEIHEAYDELVEARKMHRGRLAGYHDPGTYLLATSAIPAVHPV